MRGKLLPCIDSLQKLNEQKKVVCTFFFVLFLTVYLCASLPRASFQFLHSKWEICKKYGSVERAAAVALSDKRGTDL